MRKTSLMADEKGAGGPGARNHAKGASRPRLALPYGISFRPRIEAADSSIWNKDTT